MDQIDLTGLPTIRRKSGKPNFFQSGNCQGSLQTVGEI